MIKYQPSTTIFNIILYNKVDNIEINDSLCNKILITILYFKSWNNIYS